MNYLTSLRDLAMQRYWTWVLAVVLLAFPAAFLEYLWAGLKAFYKLAMEDAIWTYLYPSNWFAIRHAL